MHVKSSSGTLWKLLLAVQQCVELSFIPKTDKSTSKRVIASSRGSRTRTRTCAGGLTISFGQNGPVVQPFLSPISRSRHSWPPTESSIRRNEPSILQEVLCDHTRCSVLCVPSIEDGQATDATRTFHRIRRRFLQRRHTCEQRRLQR
jgi:hypothetical protein